MSFTVIKDKENEFKNIVEINSKENYGKGVVIFAQAWGRVMEDALDSGDGILTQEIYHKYRQLAEYDGISGWKFGFATNFLINFWKHGKVFEFFYKNLRLSEELSSMKRIEAIDAAQKPKWTPIGEALPATLERVYVVCQEEFAGIVKPFQTIARHIPRMTVKEQTIRHAGWEELLDYNAEDNEYYMTEGFYEWQSETDLNWKLSSEVTHWMPFFDLPEIKE